MTDSFYVDPLGNIKPEVNENLFNVKRLREVMNTREAQFKDYELRNNSQHMQLILISILTGFSLLTILVLIRNLKG